MSTRPVYHSPINVSSGSESPRRAGSGGVRRRFVYGYGDRSRTGNTGFNLGGSSRTLSDSGPPQMDSGYASSGRNNLRALASQTDHRGRSHIVISSDDDPDTPDVRLLAELAEIKEGLARVEDRIEGLW